jgi:hypothetical protein
MKDQNIEQGLHHLREHSERTPACPDDFLFTTLAKGGLALDENQSLKEHLSQCGFCIGQLADLSRIEKLEEGEPVPDLLVARARRLGKDTGFRVQAPRWAAAALVVLAVGVVFKPFSDRQTVPGKPPVVGEQLADVPQFRSIDRSNVRPEILIPSSGQALPVSEPVFEWTAVQGSLYYDVRLVSAEGETVWEERVKSTRQALPGDLQLQAGTDYYLRVDAYLAEAKRVSSRHVLFSTEGSTEEQH